MLISCAGRPGGVLADSGGVSRGERRYVRRSVRVLAVLAKQAPREARAGPQGPARPAPVSC